MESIDERSSLTAVELKRKNLRHVFSELHECSSSFLMFSLQWKDIDDHYQSLQNALEKREMEVREMEESVRQRVEAEFQDREKELEKKEKELKDLERDLNNQCRDIESKRSELGALAESVKDACRNMELRECEFSEKMASVLEAKGKEIGEKIEFFEVLKGEIVERLKEVEERGRRVERAVEEKEREQGETEMELKDMRMKIERREKEIERKEIELKEQHASITDLIRNLLKRKQHPVALEFVNEFDLIKEFLPNSIIEDSMGLSGTEEIIMEGLSIEAQNLAANKRLADSNDIAECNAYDHIRTGSVPAENEQLINSSQQKVGGDKSASSVDIGAHIPESSNNIDKNPGLVNVAILVPADTSASADRGCTNITTFNAVSHGIPGQQQIERPYPQTCALEDALPNSSIAANLLIHPQERYCCLPPHLSIHGDVKHLRTLLIEAFNYEFVQDSISSILNSSRDPAYLVLETMKNTNSSKPGKDGGLVMGIPVKGCILLLEYLNNLSPNIEPHIHREAGHFAKTWRSQLKLKKDDHMGVICFMMFLMVYNLCVALRPEIILGCLDPSCWRKQVPELCQSLGLKDVFPESFVQKIIANKEWIKAVSYIHSFGLEDKFPLASLLKDYLLHSKKKADKLCEGEINSPEVQVTAIKTKLEAARQVARCIEKYNLQSVYPPEGLEKEIEHLERQHEIKVRLRGENRKPRAYSESKRKQEHRDGDDEGLWKVSKRSYVL